MKEVKGREEGRNLRGGGGGKPFLFSMALTKIQIFSPQDAALSFILNSKKIEI